MDPAGFNLMLSGFFIAVAAFTLTNSSPTPFIFRMTGRYTPMSIGGIGLLATLVALFIARLFPNGLHITGITACILASLAVGVIATLGAWLLPLILLKKRLATRAARSKQKLMMP